MPTMLYVDFSRSRICRTKHEQRRAEKELRKTTKRHPAGRGRCSASGPQQGDTRISLSYTVFAAHTPVYALHLADEHPGDIHLLITDVVMPEMNGREPAGQLSAIRQNLKCLYISGYAADVIAHRGILDAAISFIQKPFARDSLAAKVIQVLDQME